MARIVRRTEVNECRQCATYCDRVIAPATCIADNCPNLYAYDDPLTGRSYMGCVQQVFASEIDVEQAYDGHGIDAYRCVNKRFYDWPDAAPDAVRAFDLRDRCQE